MPKNKRKSKKNKASKTVQSSSNEVLKDTVMSKEKAAESSSTTTKPSDNLFVYFLETYNVFTIAVVFLFPFILAVSLLIGSPYIVEKPGPAINVLGTYGEKQIITIQSVDNKASKDNLSLTTVGSLGMPESLPSPIQTILGFMNPDDTVLPIEAVYGVNSTYEQAKNSTKKQMDGSQNSAINAAKNYLNLTDEEAKKISIYSGDIGGPSAGMMFSLGIIDLWTGGNLTNGKTIAGTGTIEDDGTVGRIGGILQKIRGCVEMGIKYFIAPEGNTNGLKERIPAGIKVYKTKSLAESVKIVKAIANSDFDSIKDLAVN